MESESQLTKALCAFYKDVDVIHKDAKGNFGNFADLATVLSTVTPALCKNGLVVTQSFEPGETTPCLVTTLRHISGEVIESRLPMIIGSGRNPLHDFGGSVTYLRRYSLLAILGLAADVDTDGDLSAPSAPTPAQPQKAAAKPTPKQAAKPTTEDPNDPEGTLDPGLQKELLETIPALPADYITAFCKAFAVHFKTGNKKVSNCFTHYKHYTWAQDYFTKHPVES